MWQRFLEWIRPGIGWGIALLASYLIYRSVSCLIVVKKKWQSRLLLFLGCVLLSSMIIYIGDIANLPPTLLLFLGCVWFSCEGSGWKRVVIGMMVASVVLASSGFADNCIGWLIHWQNGNYYNVLFRLLFALLLYLIVRGRRTDEDFELSKPLWKLMLMLTFLPLGIVFSLVLFRSPFYHAGETILADGALFLVAIVSFLGLLRALFVLERQQRLERENMLAQHNRKYYEEMEAQQFEVRRLKHDLANHLQVLLALPEERRTSYIEGMLDDAAFVQSVHFCQDATINAVLTAKERRMRQKGIKLYARVEIPGELPFEKTDVCALFSNALDNAIEACEAVLAQRKAGKEEMIEKADAGNGVAISLTARVGKGMLAVCVKNPCILWRTKERSVGELFQTTKKDTKNHGYGLRSIREVVKKYGGNMEAKREEEQFELFLWMPVQKKANAADVMES